MVLGVHAVEMPGPRWELGLVLVGSSRRRGTPSQRPRTALVGGGCGCNRVSWSAEQAGWVGRAAGPGGELVCRPLGPGAGEQVTGSERPLWAATRVWDSQLAGLRSSPSGHAAYLSRCV